MREGIHQSGGTAGGETEQDSAMTGRSDVGDVGERDTRQRREGWRDGRMEGESQLSELRPQSDAAGD